MANPELELQGAIYNRLKADPAVFALVGTRITDRVDLGTAFPYITLGPVDSVDDDADCITGLLVTQQIDVWSRKPGFPECKTIVDAVRTALHGQEAALPLPTNGMAYLEHRNSRITRDPDGLTSHGVLSFEAAIQRS